MISYQVCIICMHVVPYCERRGLEMRKAKNLLWGRRVFGIPGYIIYTYIHYLILTVYTRTNYTYILVGASSFPMKKECVSHLPRTREEKYTTPPPTPAVAQNKPFIYTGLNLPPYICTPASSYDTLSHPGDDVNTPVPTNFQAGFLENGSRANTERLRVCLLHV